jgi:hypothetical protein
MLSILGLSVVFCLIPLLIPVLFSSLSSIINQFHFQLFTLVVAAHTSGISWNIDVADREPTARPMRICIMWL